MSDYELIMIILTFLTLLAAVDKKNNREKQTTAHLALHGGSYFVTLFG